MRIIAKKVAVLQVAQEDAKIVAIVVKVDARTHVKEVVCIVVKIVAEERLNLDIKFGQTKKTFGINISNNWEGRKPYRVGIF